MTPTRTQTTRGFEGEDRLERWEAPPLSTSRVNVLGKNANYSILGAIEPFAKVPTQGIRTLTYKLELANIANGDLVTNYTLGYAFRILSISAVVDKIATTASKAATLNLEIGTTNLTGGVLSLTTANCGTLGSVIAATAVTAANTGTATDTLSIEAASVTAFIEGSITLVIQVQNLDDLLGVVTGTGVEVVTRSTLGGVNLKTQASTPADGDTVYYAPTTNSGLTVPITASSRPTFTTQVRIGSTALTTLFASFGFNENPTDADPTGTAGEGALFLYDNSSTKEVTTGLTTAQHANWILAHKVNSVDTFTATTIPVVAGRDYELEIRIGEDLAARFYIDGVLVGTGPALTSGDSVSAFAGCELTATPAGQADIDIRYIQVGRLVG